MCECCRDTRGQWYELIELGDEEAEDCLCEFSTEEEPAICGAPARYEFKERYVEGHLCEQHMRENKEKLEEGLMDLYEATGLSESLAFKPIDAEETCDEFDLDQGVCGKPARYANIVISPTFLCERHKDWR